MKFSWSKLGPYAKLHHWNEISSWIETSNTNVTIYSSFETDFIPNSKRVDWLQSQPSQIQLKQSNPWAEIRGYSTRSEFHQNRSRFQETKKRLNAKERTEWKNCVCTCQLSKAVSNLYMRFWLEANRHQRSNATSRTKHSSLRLIDLRLDI